MIYTIGFTIGGLLTLAALVFLHYKDKQMQREIAAILAA